MNTQTSDWLTPSNSAMILVDHQTGISNGVADMSQTEFQNNVAALVKTARMFELPTLISQP